VYNNNNFTVHTLKNANNFLCDCAMFHYYIIIIIIYFTFLLMLQDINTHLVILYNIFVLSYFIFFPQNEKLNQI